MVKQKAYRNREFSREIKEKIHKNGMTIKRFCETNGFNWEIYKDYMRGNLNGRRKHYRGRETKVRKLIKAISELLDESPSSS